MKEEELTFRAKYEALLKKKNEEDLVISELVEHEKYILEDFFKEVFEKVKEAQSLVHQSRGKHYLIKDIFGIVGEIKEYGHSFKFSLLTDIVIKNETDLSEIKTTAFKNPNNITNEEINKVMSGLSLIVLTLSKYASQAYKILKIEDNFYLENLQDIHRLTNKLIVKVHQFNHLLTTDEDSEIDAYIRDIQGFLNALNQVAIEFNREDISNDIEKMIQYFLESPIIAEDTRKISANFLRKLDSFGKFWEVNYLNSPIGKHFDFDKSNWNRITTDTISLTFLRNEVESYPLTAQNLNDSYEIALSLRSFCSENKYFFLERLYTNIANLLKKGIDKNNYNDYKIMIKSAWEYIALCFYRESNYSLSLESRKNLVESLGERENQGLREVLTKFDTKASNFISFLNVLHYSDHDFTNFLKIIKEMFDESDNKSALNYFLEYKKDEDWGSFNKELVTNFLKKQGLKGINNYLEGKMNDGIMSIKLVHSLINNDPLRIQISRIFIISDILRLLNISPADNWGQEGNEFKTVQIPFYNLKNLKDIFFSKEIQELTYQQEELFERMQTIINHFTDLPLIYHLSKLKRNAIDLAHHLGKEISLDIIGAEVLLPHDITQGINSVLHSLVHNSLEHGIESVEQRNKEHKNPSGLIKINIKRAPHELEILYEDDGGGINWNGILEKYKKYDLQAPRDFDTLKDKDPTKLLFRISKDFRNITRDLPEEDKGLDAIRSFVETFEAKAGIKSKTGRGLVVRMIVPLT